MKTTYFLLLLLLLFSSCETSNKEDPIPNLPEEPTEENPDDYFKLLVSNDFIPGVATSEFFIHNMDSELVLSGEVKNNTNISKELDTDKLYHLTLLFESGSDFEPFRSMVTYTKVSLQDTIFLHSIRSNTPEAKIAGNFNIEFLNAPPVFNLSLSGNSGQIPKTGFWVDFNQTAYFQIPDGNTNYLLNFTDMEGNSSYSIVDDVTDNGKLELDFAIDFKPYPISVWLINEHYKEFSTTVLGYQLEDLKYRNGYFTNYIPKTESPESTPIEIGYLSDHPYYFTEINGYQGYGQLSVTYRSRLKTPKKVELPAYTPINIINEKLTQFEFSYDQDYKLWMAEWNHSELVNGAYQSIWTVIGNEFLSLQLQFPEEIKSKYSPVLDLDSYELRQTQRYLEVEDYQDYFMREFKTSTIDISEYEEYKLIDRHF